MFGRLNVFIRAKNFSWNEKGSGNEFIEMIDISKYFSYFKKCGVKTNDIYN